MALVTVPFGQSRRLPQTSRLTVGLEWQDKIGRPMTDLDLWIVRIHANGLAEVISWAKQALHRPDLGRDTKDNPHVATPELDVIYYSDDPDQRLGHQKVAVFNLDKAPLSVTGYGVFVTVYDPELSGLTLGSVKRITLRVIDPIKGDELSTYPCEYPWARSLAIAALNRDVTHGWHMRAVAEDQCASVETMHQVCARFNAS